MRNMKSIFFASLLGVMWEADAVAGVEGNQEFSVSNKEVHSVVEKLSFGELRRTVYEVLRSCGGSISEYEKWIQENDSSGNFANIVARYFELLKSQDIDKVRYVVKKIIKDLNSCNYLWLHANPKAFIDFLDNKELVTSEEFVDIITANGYNFYYIFSNRHKDDCNRLLENREGDLKYYHKMKIKEMRSEE